MATYTGQGSVQGGPKQEDILAFIHSKWLINFSLLVPRTPVRP